MNVPEQNIKPKNRISRFISRFSSLDSKDKRRFIGDLFFNNAMYIVITLAIIFIAKPPDSVEVIISQIIKK